MLSFHFFLILSANICFVFHWFHFNYCLFFPHFARFGCPKTLILFSFLAIWGKILEWLCVYVVSVGCLVCLDLWVGVFWFIWIGFGLDWLFDWNCGKVWSFIVFVVNLIKIHGNWVNLSVNFVSSGVCMCKVWIFMCGMHVFAVVIGELLKWKGKMDWLWFCS